jgi:putative restriction endonuclease
VVSDRALGTEGFHEVLLRYHDVPVRPPERPGWGPGRYFLDWHGREVFKGEARHRHP